MDLEYFQIIGRYMDGTSVTGYSIMAKNTGESRVVSRDTVAFLCGRGQILNATGRVYNGKFQLVGKDCNIESLPIVNAKAFSSNGRTNNKLNSNQMNQLTLVKVIKRGRDTVGYIAVNSAGAEYKLSVARVVELGRCGRLSNARINMSNGRTIIRSADPNSPLNLGVLQLR